MLVLVCYRFCTVTNGMPCSDSTRTVLSCGLPLMIYAFVSFRLSFFASSRHFHTTQRSWKEAKEKRNHLSPHLLTLDITKRTEHFEVLFFTLVLVPCSAIPALALVLLVLLQHHGKEGGKDDWCA